MRTIDTLVVHCSDTPNGMAFTVRDIDRWHAPRIDLHELAGRQEKDINEYNSSFPYIAYHDVITVDGGIHPGRGENEIGSANAPFNSTSLSVCLIGRDSFSPAQWEALKWYVTDTERRYGKLKIIGHRDCPGVTKTCPGFDVAAWLVSQQG